MNTRKAPQRLASTTTTDMRAWRLMLSGDRLYVEAHKDSKGWSHAFDMIARRSHLATEVSRPLWLAILKQQIDKHLAARARAGFLLTIDGKAPRHTRPCDALAAFQAAITTAETCVQLSHDPVPADGRGALVAFFDPTAFTA